MPPETLIAPGVATVVRKIANVLAALVPQLPEAVTLTDDPLTKAELKLALIELVPCPLLIDIPVGVDQLYVKPETAGTVYVRELPVQMFALPPVTVMVPGIDGAVPPMLTDKEEPLLVAHAFDAVTLMFPPVEPTTPEIELEVELPVQPEGSVQL